MIHQISIHVVDRSKFHELTQLARLNELFNGVSITAELICARLADPNCVETPILAEIDKCIIGFAALRLVPCVFYPEPHAELTELYVDEDFRNQGIGAALVTYAEQLAVARGAHQMVILTDFENQAAKSLYRKMGYTNEDLALSKDI